MALIPAVWGIVNVTPDSFSEGGRHAEPTRAVAHAVALLAAGADVLDIGGESTRPGSDPVSVAEELDRVVPVIRGIVDHMARGRGTATVPISIDTRRSAVAEACLDLGATIVNDVSAGRDPAMFPLVADRGAEMVLMHMLGEPSTMQQDPAYDDVVRNVGRFLADRVAAAEAAGIERSRTFADPGIGFGKTLEHNLALMRGLEALREQVPGTRWLLGASRKAFIGHLTGRDVPHERVAGSLACVVRALDAGIDAVRVHDVAATRDVLAVYARVK